MRLLLSLSTSLVPLVAAFVLFLREERAGRRASSLLVVISLLVVDCSLFSADGTTNGWLRPSLLGHGVSLTVLLVPAALAARLLRGGLLTSVRVSLVPWVLFFALMVVAAVGGLDQGNAGGQVQFELFAVINVGAVALLAAGVPVADLLPDLALARIARWSALAAGLLEVSDYLNIEHEVILPRLYVPSLGQMGADAATVFASLGLLALALELARPQRRTRQLVAAAVLLAAPVAAGQRAALAGLGICVVLFVAGVVWLRGKRRLEVSAADLVLPGVAVVAVGCVVVLVSGLTGVPLPGSDLARELGSTAKIQSAQSRVNQWRAAWELVQQHPLLGSGLGVRYRHFEVGPNVFYVQDITHNVLLDLAMRMGAVGVVLFVAAVGVSVVEPLRRRRRLHGPVAALAVAAGAGVLGVVARGMVESVLEKHRLAVLLGVLLGIAYSTAGSPADGAAVATAPGANRRTAPLRADLAAVSEDGAHGTG